MDELRWFLLILGLLVIAAVYLYGRIQEWRHDGPPWRRRRHETRDPFADETIDERELRGELDELDTLIAEERHERPGITTAAEPDPDPEWEVSRSWRKDEPPPRRAEPEFDPEPEFEPERPASRVGDVGERASPPETHEEIAGERGVQPPEPAAGAGPAKARAAVGAVSSRLRRAFGHESSGADDAASASGEPAEPPAVGEDKIIVLNVMAPEGAVFDGRALVEILESNGLRHGEHGIFHRTLETRTGTIALYSVANIVKPGWFDLDSIDEFTTPGVALFLQLPGPFDGLAAFEQMLQTARRLAGELGGHLLDGRRCDLTQQSIEHLREELLEYRRRAHLAARQAR